MVTATLYQPMAMLSIIMAVDGLSIVKVFPVPPVVLVKSTTNLRSLTRGKSVPNVPPGAYAMRPDIPPRLMVKVAISCSSPLEQPVNDKIDNKQKTTKNIEKRLIFGFINDLLIE